MDQPAQGRPFVADLVCKHGEELLRFLGKRVRTAADARDIAQEAYVRLLRLPRTDLIKNPQAYLYRIAVNLLYELDLKRRSDLEGQRRLSDDPGAAADRPSVESAADSLALRRRLAVALEALSPKCRAVLILHRRDGMTYEEIGRELGISPSMVKKYLAAGLRVCREQLGDLEP